MTQKVTGEMLEPGAVLDNATLGTPGNMLRIATDGTLEERTPAQVRSDVGAGTGNGSVTSVNVAVSGSGITPSGGPITGSGSITLTVDSDLSAVADLATTGLVTRTGTGTAATRTITGTTGRIDVTNGSGVSGNPTITIPTTALDSGTYSPTAVALSNLDTVTPGVVSYTRVLDRVTVFGIITVDGTAAGTASFELPLPIASAFAAAENAGGAGVLQDTAYLPVQIFASAANDRLVFRWVVSGTGAAVMTFSATYRII